LRLNRTAQVEIGAAHHGRSDPGVPSAAQGRPWPGDLYYGWVLVLTLGITTVISYGTSYYLFGVLVVPMGHDLGWSRAGMSGAYALGTVLAGLLGMPIGRLVDKYGARLLLSAGSLLSGLSLLGLAAVHTLWQFYLLWSVGLGLANALTFYPVSFTIVANWFDRRRGAAFALLTLLGGLASPIFVPLAGNLIPRIGWRASLVVMALLQLGLAVPLHAMVVRRRPEDLGLKPDGATGELSRRSTPLSGITLHASLRLRAFWTLTGAYALEVFASNVILVHVVAFLIGRGYSGAWAAGIVGILGLASLPGRFLLNLLSDRVGPQPLLALCMASQGIGVLLLLHDPSTGWLIAFVVVYGGAFGAISPLRAAVMADHVGRMAYGAIIALQGVPVAIAAGAGPFIAGWLYDRLHGYGLPFWLSACAFLLSGVAVALAPPPPAPQQPVDPVSQATSAGSCR
jgi:MFS family permease